MKIQNFIRVVAFTFGFSMLLNSVEAQHRDAKQVFFDNNSFELSSAQQEELLAWYQKLSRNELETITIVGYTDSKGSAKHNLWLSEKRAQTVAAVLREANSTKAPMRISYFGESRPIASNASETGRAQNRCVEVRIETALKLPKALLPDVKTFEVPANKASSKALGKNGTVLHVPANAFLTKDGRVVQGTVTLEYQEFKNAADMAFSGINMKYKEGFFNSSGMFRVSGSANGEEVEIASGKRLTIDYELAVQNEDLAFYALDEESGEWEQVQEIAPKSKPDTAIGVLERIKANVNRELGDLEMQIVEEDVPLAEGAILDRKQAVLTKGNVVDDGDRTTGTLLASGINAGHTYPKIIRGLNVESFGVYNCDQVYRLPDLVGITANYIDQNGQRIKDLRVLSLIDLRYNGAFSFDPRYFNCSAGGENVLLLFTTSKKLYALSAEEFQNMKIQTTGNYTFKMQDVTKQITSTEELEDYLFKKA